MTGWLDRAAEARQRGQVPYIVSDRMGRRRVRNATGVRNMSEGFDSEYERLKFELMPALEAKFARAEAGELVEGLEEDFAEVRRITAWLVSQGPRIDHQLAVVLEQLARTLRDMSSDN